MKVTINTVNKTIEIEQATTKELKKLCKDYEGYNIISKIINNWSYPYWQQPYYTIPCITTSTCTDIATIDYTYTDNNSTFTINN